VQISGLICHFCASHSGTGFAERRGVSSREAFGPNLRRRRIRSGLSLEDLSIRTKVSVELWDAMENNDFSRWPAGVAARAHIRAYAEAVGADPGATVDEFCRVVPQGDRRAERIVRGTAEFLGHQLVWTDDLPPELTEGDRRAPKPVPAGSLGPWWIDAHPRALAVALDVAAVIMCGGTVATAASIDFWKTLTAVALFYNGVSLALLGCSPAVWSIDTYIATHHPPKPSSVPVFTRMALARNDDSSPDRDTAA
jgi:transcriptional regulator with XRE-family HTH domain